MDTIVRGSISALAEQQNKSIAEIFINTDCIIIVDVSSSMSNTDSKYGKSRYEAACEELVQLQDSYPGKIAVLSFSDEVIFCPCGIPSNLGGTTDMAKALQFAKIADVPGMQFILISDGEPNNDIETLQIARTYQNKISTIYVGPADNPAGRNFLYRLAHETGGTGITVDRAKELKAGIEQLMLTAG